MSVETFAARWLALRAPHDSAARAVALEDRLRRALPDDARIVDLGAGRGANLLHLSPRLGGHRRWHLVDHDASHLAALPDVIGAWAQANEARVTSSSPSSLELASTSFRAHVTWERASLARDLRRTTAGADAVVASALLDLAGEAWLDELATTVAEARGLLLVTLSVDGRWELTPGDAADREVLAAFHAHMHREKGLGPALGPGAAAYLASKLEAFGLEVVRRSSDWDLSGADLAMQEALLPGIAAAATEAGCAGADAWLGRRLDLVHRGVSRLRIGHEDVYAGPSPRPTESR